jgi:hypothetical protein
MKRWWRAWEASGMYALLRRRHLAFETGVKEAVVCYNGPPPYRPEAKPFLRRALNTYFEGGPEKWNFEQEDKRSRGIVRAGGSKVIDRLLTLVCTQLVFQ